MTGSDTLAEENQTLAERLAGEIADAILQEVFAPGFRLDEQLLAQRYGVSRTPVREALRQLATTGLIDIRPRRGAIVARVTPAELEALFVAMGEMEATCARLAAMSMTPVERRRLSALHDRMAELVLAGDPGPYSLANQGFHESIYAGAHNTVLAQFSAQLRRRLAPFRRTQFRRLPRSHAEHDAVVKAILAGDSTTAHAAMLHHVSLVEDAYDAFSASSAA
jgi:DNA-binding GntR family transcriptional regulator